MRLRTPQTDTKQESYGRFRLGESQNARTPSCAYLGTPSPPEERPLPSYMLLEISPPGTVFGPLFLAHNQVHNTKELPLKWTPSQVNSLS
jgi:hypothetical protein